MSIGTKIVISSDNDRLQLSYEQLESGDQLTVKFDEQQIIILGKNVSEFVELVSKIRVGDI